MTTLKHAGCGGDLMTVNTTGKKFSAESVEYLDGTKPDSGDEVFIECPLCQAIVTCFDEMYIPKQDYWK